MERGIILQGNSQRSPQGKQSPTLKIGRHAHLL
jgi:hypothetical protein